jgi:dipeptidyl-peptidase-4
MRRPSVRRGACTLLPQLMNTGDLMSSLRSDRLASRAVRRALAAVLLSVPATAVAQLPRTGAESAGFSRTTSHQEVLDFLFDVQSRTDKMLISHLTTTDEGRMMPLVMLGSPVTATPISAMMSGKPLLFITGSVHGGEVAGKEGALQLIRELTLGEHQGLLERVNVLIVPSLNPDGAERRSRSNSKGYDMNRDFVTLETPEIAATVEKVLLEWWPDIYVDAHNGGSYPYNLTYQATLHPAADQELVGFARGPLFRAVAAHLESKEMKIYWYSGPRQDQQTGEWSWTTTEPWLRKQHSYGGFQNVVTLLFEAPARHPLELQASAQREGYVALIRYLAANGPQVRQILTGARQRMIARQNGVVAMNPQAANYPEKEQFWVMQRDTTEAAAGGGARGGGNVAGRGAAGGRGAGAGRGGGRGGRGGGTPTLVTGWNRTLYTPGETRARPWAYAFSATLDTVAGHLGRHGIDVEQLQAPLTVPVERYHLTSITQDEDEYQNHRMRTADVAISATTMTLPAGTYLVRTAQSAGMIAALMLEPDNEDSLLSWNFLDGVLPTADPSGRSEQSVLPIYRIVQPATGVRSLVVR